MGSVPRDTIPALHARAASGAQAGPSLRPIGVDGCQKKQVGRGRVGKIAGRKRHEPSSFAMSWLLEGLSRVETSLKDRSGAKQS